MPAVATDELGDFIMERSWPPMAHVRRGAERLGPEGRALVRRRLQETLSRVTPKARDRAALRRFFSFLAQVEVIAIEVPLSALPTARTELRPLLERQLADEIFHATLFAALAERMGGLDRPLPEAERLLDIIRRQEDPRTTAVLLNLVAEGWIENLFDHAATWGVADEAFRVVLEDESRHVEEAADHASGVDLSTVEPAVRAFEDELFRLVQHPRVLLPTLALAGEAGFRRLGESFLEVHRGALAEAGLAPAPAVLRFQEALAEMGRDAPAAPAPTRIEPETQWRRTALQLWDAPRHPVMHGWVELRVDHVPRSLLTAVVVAAVGRVWHEYPRVNRYTVGGELWQPPGANVGVRVAVGGKGEALSTVVVTDAHTRSVEDIRRLITKGTERLESFGAEAEGVVVDPAQEPLASVLRDEELMRMMPPSIVPCAVTVSNVGRAGLVAGFGAMPGALGQSVELIVGQIEQKPQWTGWRYAPRDTLVLGCSADHRVVDGPHAAETMRRLREALSPEGVRGILARPDTLPSDADHEAGLVAAGLTAQQGALLMSCKAPWWLGWMCWLFKK
ncbi:MAG TPA: 2-oxo acid dehydrogenase subunit E2 [Candidatus Thermoplasmatota archaeon]|nr:2-oxo acid dehydrogenase subunit E2 [Candidatus Thermoplasmatota archaeon]